MVGLLGIDFVVDSCGEAFAVDVNPRYAASMEIVQRCTGMNMVAAHLAACLDGMLPPAPTIASGPFAGKAYLFASRPSRVATLLPLDSADRPAPGTRIAAGQPVCTVFADAGQYEAVEPLLAAKIRDVEELLAADEP